ncbi:HEAT repeat-containing protein 4 [Sinocyclocheilus anshuiensis]|uniref:HEAT repeat-containing protein 4 n=1 Tax=Sinocyclocheilus anshuiensis TaxID=1608454 RepID=UPI0007B8725C|nr:PREDICTED: HEAT repeat-containing protein 4-like [Sinocyclocheilus anshuiensis]
MNLQHAKWRSEHHSKLREDHLYKQLLNNASQILSFSDEVMDEMGAISYRKADFSWLFHATGPLAPGTRLKKIKRHENNEIPCNINCLTQEEGRILVQAPAVNNKVPFISLSDQSKMYDAFRITKPFRVLNVHTYLKESSTEDWEAQSSRWQEFAQNKRSQLLQLRKQHRIPGYVLSPVSTDVQNHLNKTATTVTTKHIEIPKAPRLQDILNPSAGSHVTKNVSEQEIYSAGTGRIVKAEQRWLDQPTKIDSTLKQGLRPPDFSRQDPEMPKQSVAELSTLRYAVDQWRNACNIKLPLQRVTIEGLKRALSDPNYPVRLEAIITCALGAVNGPQEELDPGKAGQHGKGCQLKADPQELQALIVLVLDDPVKRVQMAAAVCQYAMRTPNARTRDILQSTLKQDPSGTGADSWVAAQCLAIDGDTSQAVIQRLLSQHFLRDAPSDHEQSMMLLSNISSKTTLVRSLLAEELNSANWRTRVQACTSIAQLRSPINKDLCNKLIYMMWNDWSCAVCHAAALALSKMDAAREMHSELSAKLEEGPTAWRVEALIFIGQLNIMTPKLLPTFLRCFNDDFVAVRKQACLTAASLMMDDQLVLDQLINLMQNDPLWEVKVEAIDALGKIGWMNPALQELLMWAVHHEEEPSVRIAACKALSTLDAKGPELQHFLQERYALEPNGDVQRHIESLLKKHGYSLKGNESKIHEIKLQVELLCTKHIITQKVLLMEERGKQQEQKLLC